MSLKVLVLGVGDGFFSNKGGKSGSLGGLNLTPCSAFCASLHCAIRSSLFLNLTFAASSNIYITPLTSMFIHHTNDITLVEVSTWASYASHP